MQKYSVICRNILYRNVYYTMYYVEKYNNICRIVQKYITIYCVEI